MNQDTLLRLALIEALDSKGYFDNVVVGRALFDAKSAGDSLQTKADWFFEALDRQDNYKLSKALENCQARIRELKTWGLVSYFLLGVLCVAGLLASFELNFFYIFMLVLGWHSLSLALWLLSVFHTKPSKRFGRWLNKLSPKDPLNQTALAVILAHKSTQHFAKFLHLLALASLAGNFVGFLGLFLFRAYHFTWQSTLLDTDSMQAMLDAIGFLPSFFGINPPNLFSGANKEALAYDFALLTLVSLVLYGVLPRLIALFYCHWLDKQPSHRLSKFITALNQAIIDPDDLKKSQVKRQAIQSLTSHKLIASLEIAQPIDSKFKGIDIGCLDSHDDLDRLKSAIDSHALSLYLLIDGRLLPDRGVLRKLERIAQISTAGLMVGLLKGEHCSAWQTLLDERAIFWELL